MSPEKALALTYKLMPCCANCRHCWELREVDCPIQCYCTFNADKRPKSGAIYYDCEGNISLSESWTHVGEEDEDAKYIAAMDAWVKWHVANNVMSWGSCSQWKQR